MCAPAAFRPPYLPMHETIFVERPKFLAATFNLRVELDLVYLGRFLHFSQKVVGVTLIIQLVSHFRLLWSKIDLGVPVHIKTKRNPILLLQGSRK